MFENLKQVIAYLYILFKNECLANNLCLKETLESKIILSILHTRPIKTGYSDAYISSGCFSTKCF